MISYTCWREMGKCGVFIPYHSHQPIPIPISIPMKLAWRFPFPWESHGTHGTHGNSQYILISSLHARACVSYMYLRACKRRFRLPLPQPQPAVAVTNLWHNRRHACTVRLGMMRAKWRPKQGRYCSVLLLRPVLVPGQRDYTLQHIRICTSCWTVGLLYCISLFNSLLWYRVLCVWQRFNKRILLLLILHYKLSFIQTI